jgi:hypothetical protein
MLELVALRARPDLLAQVSAPDIQGTWPEFMQHDATALLYFGKPHLDAYLDTAFAVVDPTRPDPTRPLAGPSPCPSPSRTCPAARNCRTRAGTA